MKVVEEATESEGRARAARKRPEVRGAAAAVGGRRALAPGGRAPSRSGLPWRSGAAPRRRSIDGGAALKLADRLISGRHFSITRVEGAYTLEDHDSTNGTTVDGRVVGGRTRLRDGALVLVGHHGFRLPARHERRAARARRGPPRNPSGASRPPRRPWRCCWGGCGGSPAPRRRSSFAARRAWVRRCTPTSSTQASGRRGPLRAHRLRGDPRRAAGERALRVRARRPLDRTPAQEGPHRAGPGRHAVPRRDRRDAPDPADQAAALPADPRVHAAGRDHPPPRRRARRRRDQPRRWAVPTTRPCAATSWPAWAPTRWSCRRCASRLEDLPRLVRLFLGAERKPLSQAAFKSLCLHDWPRNVRELAKVVESALVLSQGCPGIELEHLPEAFAQPAGCPAPARAARHGAQAGPRPSWRRCCGATTATWPACRPRSAATPPRSGAGSRSTGSTPTATAVGPRPEPPEARRRRASASAAASRAGAVRRGPARPGRRSPTRRARCGRCYRSGHLTPRPCFVAGPSRPVRGGVPGLLLQARAASRSGPAVGRRPR